MTIAAFYWVRDWVSSNVLRVIEKNIILAPWFGSI